ncbi:MAG TPA: AmmeMemoRadiSam system radical SAM enzyme [Dehalococcoidia bacterium]|nr:AmmeMemoRadiSam system radical SAM enzyme [Dehalococcoidia bacterium]
MNASTREATLYEKLGDSVVRCQVCQWRCVIRPQKHGLCQVRQNRDGTLYILNYSEVSSAAVDPIEKKPLFHFHPTTMVFSLGGWGCNFHCIHCQNWQISCTAPWEQKRGSQQISPEQSVKLTKQYGCEGIAWTYNEPAIWLEYTLDAAKLAKKEGLYTVYVTNGYSTPEALDAMGPYLDAWRVDVKGFSDSFYMKLAKISKWKGILEVAERAKNKWNMHVEVVTNIIPTMNDDDAQLEDIAKWIKERLGELTPWHVTRFYPQHELQDIPATPVSTLERAYDIGQKAGLRFIYVGNLHGHKGENTNCYSCGRLVVQRVGYQTKIVGLKGSKCRFCGAELNFRTKS